MTKPNRVIDATVRGNGGKQLTAEASADGIKDEENQEVVAQAIKAAPLDARKAAVAEAVSSASPENKKAVAKEAIELYTGELLPEDRYEEWAEEKREELRATYVSLLGELAALYEERGEFGPAVETLRRGGHCGTDGRGGACGPNASVCCLGPTERSPRPIRAAPGGALREAGHRA